MDYVCELNPDLYSFSRIRIQNSLSRIGSKALSSPPNGSVYICQFWIDLVVFPNGLANVTSLTNLEDLLHGSKLMLLDQDRDSSMDHLSQHFSTNFRPMILSPMMEPLDSYVGSNRAVWCPILLDQRKNLDWFVSQFPLKEENLVL